LQTDEVYFSATFDLALVGMAIFTLSGQWIRANRALLSMLSDAPEASFGPTFSDILHPDSHAVFQRVCRALHQGQATRLNIQLTYCGKHGRKISALTQIALVKQVDSPYFFAQISPQVPDAAIRIEDEGLGVTGGARKLAEHNTLLQRLRASEQKFRTLAENSPNIILRYDDHLRRIYANPAYLREIKLPFELALGDIAEHTWSANIPLDKYREKLTMVLASGTSSQIQVDWTRPGADFASSFVLQMMAERAANNQIVGILVLGINVSDLKQTEQRLRELVARRDAEREEERRSIAREIHDELGQHLTALRMKISSLRVQFGHETPLICERTHELTAQIDASLRVVRTIVSSLRPAALDMGIIAALEWLIAEFHEHSGLSCHLRIPPLIVALDDERATTIFRVVQESLTNIARHAQASRVEIKLEVEPAGCQVSIHDNGRGFDTHSAHKDKFGLMGMRERALTLGGSLEIDSSADQGTTVRVIIPLPFVDRES